MLRSMPPIEADLDNMEEIERLTTNANILAVLLHYYFGLRLEGHNGTPGQTPQQALEETMQWATKMHLLPEPLAA